MHYYQFNIGDYAKATRHLSNEEDLAYRRLIDLYYDKEKPLPKDVSKLSRLINMRENQAEIKAVLDDFFVDTENGYQQKRIEVDIENYRAKAEAARLNGKRGGRPRKPKTNPAESESKAKETQSVNLANPTESESKAKKSDLKSNQEPITNNQEPRTNNQVIKETSSAKADNSNVLEVFNYWKQVMKKSNQSKLTPERSRKIQARLKEGYTVEQIKMAIFGCSVTPHNMGQNDNGKRYDQIELICRTGSNVERFAGNAQSSGAAQYSPSTQRTIDNIRDVELD